MDQLQLLEMLLMEGCLKGGIQENEDSNINARVNFWIEELDAIFTDEKIKNIPADKSKEFSMDFNPIVPGKHKLIIQIYVNDLLVIIGLSLCSI